MANTTTDLYRLGNASSPRMDNVRPQDIETYQRNNVTWVRAGTGGISTFSTRPPGRNCWKLSSGSAIPSTLRVTNDHGNHWLWEPVADMTLDDYKAALRQAGAAFQLLPNVSEEGAMKLSPKAVRFAEQGLDQLKGTEWAIQAPPGSKALDLSGELGGAELSWALSIFENLSKKLKAELGKKRLSDDERADAGNDLAFVQAVITGIRAHPSHQ